jgi:hypothetical protein
MAVTFTNAKVSALSRLVSFVIEPPDDFRSLLQMVPAQEPGNVESITSHTNTRLSVGKIFCADSSQSFGDTQVVEW